MGEEVARWLQVLGIIFFALSWMGLALYVARDMDRRGRKGGLYGIGVLLVPPLGLLAWLWDRRSGKMTVLNAEFLLVAIVTFPFSLIAWLLITQPWHPSAEGGG